MNLKHFVSYQLLLANHGIDKNSMGLVLPYGLGDTYIICSLISDFIKLNKIQNLFLIVKPGHDEVIKLFNLSVKTVVVKNMSEVIHLCKLFGQKKLGNIYVAHPNYIKDSSLTSLIGYKGFNLADMYRAMLNIPLDSSLQLPRSPKKMSDSHFRKLGLVKHKSIILFPEANSIDAINSQIWESIADYYKKSGFFVFSSVSKSINVVKGTQSVNIPIANIREVASFGGYVIALRSGICEVMSTSKAKMMVLYPDIDWYSGPFILGSSLVKMQLNTTVTEIVVHNNHKVSNQVLTRFVNE